MTFSRNQFCCFARPFLAGVLLLGASVARAAEKLPEVVAPKTDSPPVIDGRLTDPCWKTAARITGLTRPLSFQKAPKPITARVCFDDAALYFGITCSEPHPERLRARVRRDGRDVWTDDCIEVFLRPTNDVLDVDQFIVNTVGAKQTVRRRTTGPSGDRPSTDWQAGVRAREKAWTAELRIPFTEIGLRNRPHPGRLVELKIGREDYTTRKVALSVWPPGAPYAGAERYGLLFLGNPNRLPIRTWR